MLCNNTYALTFWWIRTIRSCGGGRFLRLPPFSPTCSLVGKRRDDTIYAKLVLGRARSARDLLLVFVHRLHQLRVPCPACTYGSHVINVARTVLSLLRVEP